MRKLLVAKSQDLRKNNYSLLLIHNFIVMKSTFQLKNVTNAILPVVVAMLLAFFGGNTSVYGQQSYLTPEEASLRLKSQTEQLASDLQETKVQDADYIKGQSTLNYYYTILSFLSEGNSVPASIEKAVVGICYSTATADCTSPAKTVKQEIIDETRTFLSN
jgi:hypothetical protein